MKEKDFTTIINGIESLDSNMMEMLQGGYFSDVNDCTCGSANSNTTTQPDLSSDCTCGSGNSNKEKLGNCSCGAANSNVANPTLGQLQFG